MRCGMLVFLVFTACGGKLDQSQASPPLSGGMPGIGGMQTTAGNSGTGGLLVFETGTRHEIVGTGGQIAMGTSLTGGQAAMVTPSTMVLSVTDAGVTCVEEPIDAGVCPRGLPVPCRPCLDCAPLPTGETGGCGAPDVFIFDWRGGDVDESLRYPVGCSVALPTVDPLDPVRPLRCVCGELKTPNGYVWSCAFLVG